jgi:hypothetical protein
MTVREEQKGWLIGFVNPVGMTPAFAIPAFSRQDGSNQLLAQVIDKYGKVVGFRDFDASASELKPVTDGREVMVGDASIFVFQFSECDYVLGDERSVSETLADRAEFFVDRPFLNLQLRHFQRAEEEVLQASKLAFEHLLSLSPKSARLWRDLVAVPLLVRQTIAAALDKLGARRPPPVMNEEIEVAGTQFIVRLTSPIVTKLRGLLLVRERVQEIGEAFGLTASVEWDMSSTHKLQTRVRVTESDLVLPTLEVLAVAPNRFLGTSDLIRELTGIFQPTGADAGILQGRNDTYFSQKVRNMISHRESPTSFIRNGLVKYDATRRGLQITEAGLRLLEKGRT